MFRKKQPGEEASQEQEILLHSLDSGDHLKVSADGKASIAAGSEDPNYCFSDAEAMAPGGDHDETYQGLLQLNNVDLLVNSPETYDLSSAALAQAMLLPEAEDLVAASFDMHALPQLLDYEGFPNFLHDF